jgi:hypothetical protein
LVQLATKQVCDSSSEYWSCVKSCLDEETAVGDMSVVLLLLAVPVKSVCYLGGCGGGGLGRLGVEAGGGVGGSDGGVGEGGAEGEGEGEGGGLHAYTGSCIERC